MIKLLKSLSVITLVFVLYPNLIGTALAEGVHCDPVDIANLTVYPTGASLKDPQWLVHDIMNDSKWGFYHKSEADRLVEIFKGYKISKFCVVYDAGNLTLMRYMLAQNDQVPKEGLVQNEQCVGFDRNLLKIEWSPPEKLYKLTDGKNPPVRSHFSKGPLITILNMINQFGFDKQCNEPPGSYDAWIGEMYPNINIPIEYWTKANIATLGGGSSSQTVGGSSRTIFPTPRGTGSGRLRPGSGSSVAVQPGGPVFVSSVLCNVSGNIKLDPGDNIYGYLHYKGLVNFHANSNLEGVNLTLSGPKYFCTCVTCPSHSSHATGLQPEGAFKSGESRDYMVDCVSDKNAPITGPVGKARISHFVKTTPSGAGTFGDENCGGNFSFSQ
jgi:hypothetical protein